MTREIVSEIQSGGGLAQAEEEPVKDGFLTVVYAACPDLAFLTRAHPQTCHNKPQWLNGSPRVPSHLPSGVVLGHGERVPLPDAREVTTVAGLPSELNGALLLPPNLAAASPRHSSTSYFLVVPSHELMGTVAELSARAPTMQFDLGGLEDVNPDFRQFPAQLEILTLGTVLSLLVAALAVTAAVLGEAPERATRMRGLRVMGAPRREIVRAHTWASAMPLITLGWLALFVGWVVCVGMRNLDDRASFPFQAMIWTGVLVPLVALVVALITLPDALRPSHRSAAVEA